MTSSYTQGQLVTLPIVGAKFRPPAAGLLAVLGTGAGLLLRREPDNAYDANAVQVLAAVEELKKLPRAQLQSSVEGFGFSAEEVLGEELTLGATVLAMEWHLGYIPRSAAEGLAEHFDSSGIRDRPGSLTFDLQGRPAVSFVVP